MMVTHRPSFVEGGPYWSTKRTLNRLLVRFPEYKSTLPLLAHCRLTGGRRTNKPGTSSLRIEPRGVKSDEMLTLWEEM